MLSKLVKKLYKPLTTCLVAGSLLVGTPSKAKADDDFLFFAAVVGMAAFVYHNVNNNYKIPQTLEEQEKLMDKLEKKGYKKKYDTIAHRFLDVGKGFGTKNIDYFIVDKMIDKGKKRLQLRKSYTKKQALHALKTIDNIIKELKFDRKTNFFMHSALRIRKDSKRYIDCDSGSAIYIAIAEQIGLDLKLVKVPSHVFIRCYYDKGNFNWETLHSKEKTDKEYIEEFGITQQQLKHGYVMKDMSEGEFFANFNHILAAKLAEGMVGNKDPKLNKKQTLDCYKRAVELDSQNPLNWTFLGAHHSDRGEKNESLRCYSKAIHADPEFTPAYVFIGNHYKEKGDTSLAKQFYEKAIEIDPEESLGYQSIAKIHFEQGEFKESLQNYNKAIEFNSESAELYEGRMYVWQKLGDEKKAEEDFNIMQEIIVTETLLRLLNE